MHHHDLFTDNNNEVSSSKDIFDWYSDNHDKAIVVWDENGQIVYLSRAFTNRITRQEEELLGQNWTVLFSEWDLDSIQSHFSSEVNKLKRYSMHIEINESKKLYGDIIIDRIMVYDQLVFICQLDNRAYIKELEEIIVDNQKTMLSAQLAAGLVHEIRNPLTSIKGFIQLIQAGVQQKESFYQVIINEIDHLEKITTELLQIAKPFKGDMREEYVHELIEDISLVMNVQSNFAPLTLEVMCDEDLLVTCNAAQIKQIIINLLLNAIEAMNNKGVITLQAYQRDNQVVIDVIDEGEGISNNIIKELEQPFFTTKEKGTGLGLSISKHLLDLHDAKLTVKQNDNQGSTFTVLLPLSNKE